MIATLNDPRNPNDANVTLSRNDDLRRYSQNLRQLAARRRKHIPVQNWIKGVISRIGKSENALKDSFIGTDKSGNSHLADGAANKRDDITPFIEKLKESVAASRAIDTAHKHNSKEEDTIKNLNKEDQKKKDFTENRFPHFYAHISSVHTAPRIG